MIEDNDDVDVVDCGGDDIACKELSTACGPELFEAAASIGLLNGDTPLELNGEDDAVLEGEGLRIPFVPLLLLDILLIVVEMVCLAACLALSVDTKLLTKSLRFPFTSGVASSSKDLPTLAVSDDDFGLLPFDLLLVPSDNRLLED